MEKNMIVIDENGLEIGRTYPKRAKGLVKNGRAEYVDERTIRLYENCPTVILQEEIKTMNTILFNARDWKKSADAGVTERSFMTVFDELKEVYAVGTPDAESVAISTLAEVEPNSEYSFVFWAKVGESEVGNEVSQLQITYTDGEVTAEEDDDKAIYRLNKSYIKPVKSYKGWKLFCIPFNTEEKKYVQLKFVVAASETLITKADIEMSEEKEEKTSEQDIKAVALEYAKKFGDSAKKIGGKAVELGKKYKEPAIELGEKGLNGLKKGTEKIVNSDAFKKVEDSITSIFSSKSDEAEATETVEEAIDAAIEEAAEATEKVEAIAEEAVEAAEEKTEE